MDLDNFLTQMDTFTRLDSCASCTALKEQLSLLLEVVKAKEQEINELQAASHDALERAKSELRSEAETRIRESLALQVHAQLKRELKSKVIDEIKGNFLDYLNADYRKQLEQQMRESIQKEADDNALAKIESIVYQKLASERASLRAKSSELYQLREQLLNENKIKQLEMKYHKQIEELRQQSSKETARCNARIAELKKKLADATDAYTYECYNFKIEKGNLEREIEFKQHYIEDLQRKCESGALEHRYGEVADCSLQTSRLAESKAVQFEPSQRSISGTDSQLPENEHFYAKGADAALPAPQNAILRPQAPESAASYVKVESLSEPMGLIENYPQLQFTSRRPTALKMSEPAVTLQTSKAPAYQPSPSVNRLYKAVSDALEADRREQLAFKQLPEIVLPNNQLGKMLGSAFTFLFDYYDRCEVAYAQRSRFVAEAAGWLQKRQYDVCLKAIQAELLQLRDLDRSLASIYDMIRQREATKHHGADTEFDRRLAYRLRDKRVLYRGVDYWDVLRAECVIY